MARSTYISLDLPEGTIPAAPGGVTDHHITVAYLGRDLSDEAYATAYSRAQTAAAAAPAPLVGVVAGIGSFEPSTASDQLIPVYAAADIPGLNDLAAALTDLSASEFTDYHPHVTLAYVQPGQPFPHPVPPTPVAFTHLTMHHRDSVARIPLGPAATATPAMTWTGPDGTVYDLGHGLRDKDGDVWVCVGWFEPFDGAPIPAMEWNYEQHPLTQVIECYGPLTKRAED